jgi:hypothetical protein
MEEVICLVSVAIDREKIKKLGYETIDDYLNECKFCVYDDENDDICVTVEEYLTEGKNEIF